MKTIIYYLTITCLVLVLFHIIINFPPNASTVCQRQGWDDYDFSSELTNNSYNFKETCVIYDNDGNINESIDYKIIRMMYE